MASTASHIFLVDNALDEVNNLRLGPPLVRKNGGICAAGAEIEKNGQKKVRKLEFWLEKI